MTAPKVTTEKLIVKLDSQILNSMNLCPQRYEYEHVMHWRPLKKDAALEKGSIIHKMTAHYRLGKKAGIDVSNPAMLIKQCLLIGEEAVGLTSIPVSEFNEILRPTFQDYVLRWQYDGWEIIDVEQPFSKILYEDSNPIVLDGIQYSGFIIIYEGIIDARVRDPKIGEVVVDTKTESRKSYPYILSNQFQGYEWAFNVPVIVDKVGFQTSLPANEKFRRLEHNSGEYAIEEWRRDTIIQVFEAIEWHRSGVFKRNRTSCDKYSGCIFQKVCKVPDESRPFKLQANYFKDKQWDPYTRDDEESDE